MNIEIRQWKELERKHEELKGKQQELEKVKGGRDELGWIVEMISELEKDTDSELRKRHTEKSIELSVCSVLLFTNKSIIQLTFC